MARPNKAWTTPFQESVHLLLELHREMSQGDPDGGAADAVRDSMERPWFKLTESEQVMIRGLSADLYDIGRIISSRQTSEVQIPQSIREATGNAEWERLLELLRSNETSIPADAVSYLRGVAWFHLGQPQVAKEFLANAVHIAPNVLPAYLHYYFYTLIALRKVKDALPYADEIAARSNDPLLLLDAAEVFFVYSTEVEGSLVDTVLSTAQEVAARGLKLANEAEQDEVLAIQCGLTYLWMALAFARSDDLDSAYQSVNMAQRFIPDDPGVIWVESWLAQRAQSASWDQGVGIGLIQLRRGQTAALRAPFNPVSAP